MILYDDIMLFLCLDAKETKIKGGETFYKEKHSKPAVGFFNSANHVFIAYAQENAYGN